ncbi:MAG: hypothetical protein JSV04_01305, partial [Candidatus Heimdallarchaeota archaeon]
MNKDNNRAQLEKEFLKARLPFTLDKSIYQRFSQRNNIFARVSWDESFSGYKHTVSERAAEKFDKEGYSLSMRAFDEAIWSIYQYFPFGFNWSSIRGTNGDSSPNQPEISLPKYDSTDLNS